MYQIFKILTIAVVLIGYCLTDTEEHETAHKVFKYCAIAIALTWML